MKKVSKRFSALKAMITKKTYSFSEGVQLLKQFEDISRFKFLESIEAHVSLNIDPKYANQQLRASLILPHGTGKNIKIAVLTDTENCNQILQLGVFLAGSDKLLEQIEAKNLNFDVLITTPAFMPKLIKFGKILGPKLLMPSPKLGTVTYNLEGTIKEFQKGKFEYRADKNGVVHFKFGTVNFDKHKLLDNLVAIHNSIQQNKPCGVKGKYIKSFYICTTMSPSINLDFNSKIHV